MHPHTQKFVKPNYNWALHKPLEFTTEHIGWKERNVLDVQEQEPPHKHLIFICHKQIIYNKLGESGESDLEHLQRKVRQI